MNKFSKSSIAKLSGVHPALILVVSRALLYSPVDFGITEGLRTLERQKILKAEGKSQTLNSRHLHGCAVDVVAYVNGKISWDLSYYKQIAEAFEKASLELNIPIISGINWKTLVDGPHHELNRDFYPDTVKV